jgi:hypothetical protein
VDPFHQSFGSVECSRSAADRSVVDAHAGFARPLDEQDAAGTSAPTATVPSDPLPEDDRAERHRHGRLRGAGDADAARL